MEIRKNISAPFTGMNRDSNLDRLQDGEFTFALNSDSNGRVRHNEPSNYLYTIFPEGYKVISEPLKDLLNRRTFYWLTNPETSFSSFGYVIDKKTFHDNNDQEGSCATCDPVNNLSTPLEDTEQTPEFEYVELFHDRCLPIGEGLNLHIDYPIKSPVLKSELGGTVVYWEDDRNPPRYAKVDDVSYLYEQEIPCEDSQTTPCLQVNKLLQFPFSTPIEVEAVSQDTGGNLRRGSYQVFVAYSDEFGAEMSNYSTGTNAVKIFDINNNVLEDRDLDNTTNYSIRVKVNNLDFRNFKYYRVVVVERGVLDSTEIAYEEGIFPTTVSEFSITSSGRLYRDTDRDVLLNPKKVVELNTLFTKRPIIERADGEAIIGNRKYIHGIKRKETVNIQPVVNLFSPLAEWQTAFAKDTLYEDGVNASKYGSYMRDEVQPFSLRLINKDGSKSDNFLMMSRPPNEEDLEEVSEDRILEFSDAGCKGTDRIHKWQYENTAKLEGQCELNIETVEVQQNDVRNCVIENVFTIPANTISIELETDFTSLQDYIEENPDIDIPVITDYLDPDNYTGQHCDVRFGIILTSGTLEKDKKYIIRSVNEGDNFSNVGYTTDGEIFIATDTTPISWSNGTEVEETFCDLPELTKNTVEIAEVTNEVVKKYEAEFPDDYSKITSSNSCNIYSRGDDGQPVWDNEFAAEFDAREGVGGSVLLRMIWERDYSFFNESCPTSEYIQWLSTGGYLQKYWFNYLGGVNREDLETNKRSENDSTELESDGVSGFSSKIASGSLWFVGDTMSKDKFILEVTKAPTPSKRDHISAGYFPNNVNQKVRISIFNRCSDPKAIFSTIHLIANKNLQLEISVEETEDGEKLTIYDGEDTYTYLEPTIFPSNKFYVVVEPYIYKTKGLSRVLNEDGEEVLDKPLIDKVRTAPPLGCFSIALRDIEYTRAEVSWDGIVLNKLEEYTASCNYQIPKDLNCDPIPYQKGRFAYWESTHTYPDNPELYDSSNLKINPSHLNFHPYTLRQRFEEYFVEDFDQEGNYVLKGADFRCKPIRHFKFPDNRVAPFTNSINLPNGSDSFIYPIGITLDARVVQSMLVVALENKLITKEQYDNVVGFEILKGDNLYSRSVVANGILFDMYKYEDKGEDIYYSNFPYNGLGDDLFHREMTSDNNIKHPFNSRGNNKFTFISPDLLHTNTSLSNELSIQGYLRGHSNSTFVELEDHAKWTILGRKARRTANTLAWAEFAVEAAISIGTTTSNQWFMVGLAGGTSLGLIGTAIVAAANVASGYSKIGDYRYQWLETFKNLGAKYNFGYYGYSKADYNTFIKNRDNKTILNKLSVSKYLPSGHFTVLDKGSKDTYKINNHLRESSILLSTGEKVINYPPDYYQIDISTNSGFSGTTSGRVDCQNSFSSSVASPYATLKNYVPDQYGEVGSISWVPTGKQYYFGRDNRCEPTFGGDVAISRFYYRRKMPLFTHTAYNYPDKTTFEYSSKFNVARAKYYVDYETDTEYNDLLIPFPDIDSEYYMDCQSPNNRFYIKRGKIYTAYYSFPGFLVESRMNLNWRYGGKEMKDQFYPLQADLEEFTQEKNVSIREQEKILYKETYSLGNVRGNSTILPYSYNREFYKKLSDNKNETIWSQMDISESSRTQDPWLVYKPLDVFSFDTKNGLLKSLKEATTNTAVARFTNNMQVFNTVDVLAERVTPQTQDLGTGGIFAKSRPVSFINSPLGFSGTQQYNVISTEFGDIHIDAEKGQVFLLNNQGNQLEDIAYSYQGTPSNMNKWFKKHLPFKIKNYFPEVDTDNPFKGLGISGGYDAVNKRAFITKLDVEPISDCVEYDAEKGLVVNETKCNEAPQVPICPEGYEFNTATNKCERVLYNSPCPIGYTYSPGGVEEIVTETCANPLDIVFILDATGSQGGVINNIKNGITTEILPSIISQFGEDYRLGLVAVKDRRVAGSSLFDILEPMSIGNVDTFIDKLNTVEAAGGASAAEPYDLALEAVLDNTREIDLNKDFTSNTLTIGQFREEASKVVVITSDNPPSSNIDNFTWDVWEETQNILQKAIGQEVQIFTYYTPLGTPCANLPLVAPTNPIVPIATPCTNNYVSVTPYAPYVLNYIADITGGQYSLNQNGQGISSDLSEKIEQSVSCTSNTEIVTVDPGCIEDETTNACITDLVLVVDRSGSIVSSEMVQQKLFLKEIVLNLKDKLDSGNVKIGISIFGTLSDELIGLTSVYNEVIQAIDSIPNNNLGQSTNTISGLCTGREILQGANSREDSIKQIILVTDGRASSQIYDCTDATSYLTPSQQLIDLDTIKYGAKLKSEGIYITTIALGDDCERLGVLKMYGGDKTEPDPSALSCTPSQITLYMGSPADRQEVWNSEYYPLSSIGNGLFGYSTYESDFQNAVNIAYDISNNVCNHVHPINCGDCEFDEDLGLCVCQEEVDPYYVDYLSPADLTNSEYFRDVSWTIAFKFEDKGWNSYHSFTPNFYNPHQDFFQTGFNSNSSKLWSHTLEDNSFQVFQGHRKPFIVETVITNKNTSKYLNSIAIESEAIRYQDGVDSSQWWDKGFDTLTIYNNTDNSGRLKLTPLKNYRDLTKYPITNSDNTQTITFVPQDEKQIVNYFYNRTRREDRNIPQWVNDRNQIMKDVNPRAVKFTGKQLLERLRGNSFIIRLENESESRFKLNLKDVITEETNYQS